MPNRQGGPGLRFRLDTGITGNSEGPRGALSSGICNPSKSAGFGCNCLFSMILVPVFLHHSAWCEEAPCAKKQCNCLSHQLLDSLPYFCPCKTCLYLDLPEVRRSTSSFYWIPRGESAAHGTAPVALDRSTACCWYICLTCCQPGHVETGRDGLQGTGPHRITGPMGRGKKEF